MECACAVGRPAGMKERVCPTVPLCGGLEGVCVRRSRAAVSVVCRSGSWHCSEPSPGNGNGDGRGGVVDEEVSADDED